MKLDWFNIFLGAVPGFVLGIIANGLVVPWLKRFATGERRKEKEAERKQQDLNTILKIMRDKSIVSTTEIKTSLEEKSGKSYEIDYVHSLLSELEGAGKIKDESDKLTMQNIETREWLYLRG